MRKQRSAGLLLCTSVGVAGVWGWLCGSALAEDARVDADVPSVTSTADQDLTIEAMATRALSVSDLGRPFSAQFKPLISEDGKTMFPKAGAAIKISVNETTARFVAISSTAQLQANADMPGFASGAVGVAAATRFLVFQVAQLERAIEVNDTTAMRLAPQGGAYYLRKIFFGRKFEMVISGDASVFTADVRTRLLHLPIGADIKAEASKARLRVEVVVRGLKPKASALVARSADEILAQYAQDNSNGNEQVPILVEYRRIPGAAVTNSEIAWQAAGPSTGRVIVRKVRVEGTNSDWLDTGLVLAPGDILVGSVAGNVKICDSCWAGNPSIEADANGAGGLDFRTGTIEKPAGKNFLLRGMSSDAGPSGVIGAIKLRVRDSNHKDNSGGYDVVVTVIPAALMAAADCGPAGCDVQ